MWSRGGVYSQTNSTAAKEEKEGLAIEEGAVQQSNSTCVPSVEVLITTRRTRPYCC